MNAAGVHSDAAIVGLQATHMLRGEWSPLLFGSSYQTSVDSAIAALFFAPAGPGPLALMLSTLTGHLVLTLLVFATLRRHVGVARAFALSLVLVFTPPSVHTYVLHPPRQASLTLAFASFWAFDRASGARASAWTALGGALVALACFADPYALVFVPSVAAFALLGSRDASFELARVARRVVTAAAGAALGAVPLLLLWRAPGAKHGPTGLTLAVIDHNWDLLERICLPWGLSYQAWSEQGGRWAPWAAPPIVRIVQIAGAIVLVSGIAFAVLAAPMRRVPWGARALGIAGAVACASTVAGFLGSVMVMDAFSTRYLAAIVLAAPFALAPLAALVRPRALVAILAPYLASAALAGWLGFVPWTHGLAIARTDDGTARDERALERALSSRGVKFAMADYWVSYRLTFLYDERVIVVPKNVVEDRYAPYAEGFEHADVVAYVFDPERSREAYASIPDQLADRGVHFTGGEWLREGRLTALVVTRQR